MRRVAITTATERAGRVARSFSTVGLDPVLLPCIETRAAERPVLAAVRQLADRADLIVLTSATTVPLVWGDAAPLAPVAAVGAVTASAVRDRGGMVAYVGHGTGRDLAEAISLEGVRVVFPHAEGVDPEVVRILEERAEELDHRTVYRSVPIVPGGDPVDMVAFGSPSAVEGWRMSRTFDDVRIGVIGPRTAVAVERHGGIVHVIAEVPRFDALAEAFRSEVPA